MKTKFNSMALVAAALVALTSAGFADDKKASVNDNDMKFIKQMAADSKAEVQIAELGVKKAESSDVKMLAERLVADHTALNNDLQALADKKNVDLSAIIAPSGAREFQKLEGYSGKDFDDSFLKNIQSDHKSDISRMESAQKKAEDADLKAFIDKALPGMRSHLDETQKLLGKLSTL